MFVRPGDGLDVEVRRSSGEPGGEYGGDVGFYCGEERRRGVARPFVCAHHCQEVMLVRIIL